MPPNTFNELEINNYTNPNPFPLNHPPDRNQARDFNITSNLRERGYLKPVQDFWQENKIYLYHFVIFSLIILSIFFGQHYPVLKILFSVITIIFCVFSIYLIFWVNEYSFFEINALGCLYSHFTTIFYNFYIILLVFLHCLDQIFNKGKKQDLLLYSFNMLNEKYFDCIYFLGFYFLTGILNVCGADRHSLFLCILGFGLTFFSIIFNMNPLNDVYSSCLSLIISVLSILNMILGVRKAGHVLYTKRMFLIYSLIVIAHLSVNLTTLKLEKNLT